MQITTYPNQIGVGSLQFFERAEEKIYYFVHDFIVGEFLSESLTREIYLGLRQSCLLCKQIINSLNELKSDDITITPETVFLNYEDDDTKVLVLPILVNQFIKNIYSR